jgi:biphenyl 2,3-dioxygenase beta subunit
MAGEVDDPGLQHRVEQFLFREARLLDDRQLLEWVDLFTDEGEYLMYLREKVQKHARGREQSADVQLLFRDDRNFLGIRARRILETQLAHAEKPPSITRRLITNVTAWNEGGVIRAKSNFVAYQARMDVDDFTFFGTRDDTLAQDDDDLRIARRVTVLDQFVLARTLTILF